MLRRRAGVLLLAALLIFFASPVSAAPTHTFDFSDWHLPLPAGEWRITRGPCNSPLPFDHQCGYYEDQCAIDLVPVSGSMTGVPVLAPQAGRVFFIGTRNDAGQTVLLRHADGRISALMHLSKIVVEFDQAVSQGQVVGYAGGTGSSSNPHLHFHVQPNAVERQCLPLTGIDDVDLVTGTAISRNRLWEQLTLPDPPPTLPDFLPGLAGAPNPGQLTAPGRVLLGLGAEATIPILVAGQDELEVNGIPLDPVEQTASYSLFEVPVTAPDEYGNYALTLRPLVANARIPPVLPTLRYSVRPEPNSSPGAGVLLINPDMLSPRSYSFVHSAPRLCWSENRSAGPAPLRYRVMVVGPTPADSGWIRDTCWQTPTLSAGSYLWKVFVRDGRGYMNRTNQRPFAFTIYGK